jgi:hypothetical protein
MGKDAILADRCALSDRLIGERGPRLPQRKAIQPTKMVDVILRVAQLGRIIRDILEANLAAENRANVLIGTPHQKPPCRGAMTCIHLEPPFGPKHTLLV